MKKVLIGLLTLGSLSVFALECPEGSFLVQNVEAYQLDYREVWGERYELSVSGSNQSTPRNFSASLVIENSDILAKVKKFDLPILLGEICVESRESDLVSRSEMIVLTNL